MARFDSILTGSLVFNRDGVFNSSIVPHANAITVTGSLKISGSQLIFNGSDINTRITTLEAGQGADQIKFGAITLWTSSINSWTASIEGEGYATTGSNHFTGTQFISGHIIPEADSLGNGLYDLGSVTKPFRDLYLTTSSLKFVKDGEIFSTVSGEQEGIRVGNILITTSSLLTVNDDGEIIDTIYEANISASGELEEVTQHLPLNVVSSSAQIDALGFLSSSITGIISRSAQISDLGFITSSISDYEELTNIPSGIVSSSAQLASEISGAGAVTYVTSSNFSLKQLQVNDYDADVAATFDDSTGKLTLTFGTPAEPSSFSFSLSGFATDRFNQEVDSYNINASWNNGGYTLHTASIYEGNTLLTEVTTGTSISFPTSSIGNHTYTLKYTGSSPLDNSLYNTTRTVSGNLSKSNPSSPTLTTTPTVQLGYSSNQIEQGATGSITITSSSANPSNSWELDRTETNFKSPYAITGSATGSSTISITATAYYDSPAGDNSPDLSRTATRTNSYTKIRSVRRGASAQASFTAEELADLALWDTTLGGSIGTIDKGNTSPSGDSVTISWSGDKYHYIVYDSSRSNLSNITTSGFGVLGQFSVSTVGQYKVYKTNTLQAGGAGSSITYVLT